MIRIQLSNSNGLDNEFEMLVCLKTKMSRLKLELN